MRPNEMPHAVPPARPPPGPVTVITVVVVVVVVVVRVVMVRGVVVTLLVGHGFALSRGTVDVGVLDPRLPLIMCL
jgi:hypothetical protein